MSTAPGTETAPVIASCSFCGKPNTEVAKLVAGPGVYICNECVALSQQVIDADTRPPGGPAARPVAAGARS